MNDKQQMLMATSDRLLVMFKNIEANIKAKLEADLAAAAKDVDFTVSNKALKWIEDTWHHDEGI